MEANMKLIPLLSITLLFLLVSMDSPIAKAGGDEETVIVNMEAGEHGWLGVMLAKRVTHTMDDGEEKIETSKGVLVEEVIDDSPADSAGIEDGDIITKINGEDVEDPDDVIEILREMDPDELVNIVVERDGSEKTIGVVLGERKSSYAIVGNMYKMMAPLKKLGKSITMFTGNKPVLGIKIKTLEKQLGEYFKAPNGKGVLVTEVLDIEGSPAKQAGLKAGDVLVNINGESIEDLHDIQTALSDMEKDDDVKMEVIRNGSRMKLSAKITEDVRSHKGLESLQWHSKSHLGSMGHGSKDRQIRIITPDGDTEEMDFDFDIDIDELKDDAKKVRIKMMKIGGDIGEHCKELMKKCEKIIIKEGKGGHPGKMRIMMNGKDVDLDECCEDMEKQCEEICTQHGAMKEYRIQLDKHKGMLDTDRNELQKKIEKIIRKKTTTRDV
jgi:C-terminal processing protease CtpA/Prc